MSVGYSPSEISELLSRSDLISYLRDDLKVKLIPSGRGYMCCCPLHQEDTPSFHVSLKEGKWLWHCFGACEPPYKGGNIIGLYQALNHCEFEEAVETLAEKYGVLLSPRYQQEKAELDRKRAVLLAAQDYFVRELQSSGRALDALEDRRVSLGTARSWGIGYSGEEDQGLLRYLSFQGFKIEEILAQGLVKKSERYGTPTNPAYYDFFRDRLTFPLYDHQGKITGFTSRDLSGEAIAKYMNSPEKTSFGQTLFRREEIFYGLEHALKAIRDAKFAYVTEGNFDVISAHRQGLENVVAPLGTSAFSSGHVNFLSRWCNNLVFVFDHDEAGIKAALRAAKLTYEKGLNPEFVVIPKVEGKKKIDLDEFLRSCEKEGKNPREEFLLLPRLDIVHYFMETHRERINLDSPSGKFQALDQLVECFKGETRYSRKIIWIREAADTLGIDPRAVEERYFEKLDDKKLGHGKWEIPRNATEIAWCFLANLSLLPPTEVKVMAHDVPVTSRIFEPIQAQYYQSLLDRPQEQSTGTLELVTPLKPSPGLKFSLRDITTVLDYVHLLHHSGKIDFIPPEFMRILQSRNLSKDLHQCKQDLAAFLWVEEEQHLLSEMARAEDIETMRKLATDLSRINV